MEKKKIKKGWIITGSILLVIGITWGVIALIPPTHSIKGVNKLIRAEDEAPLLIAHGGGNLEFPDNTIEACYNALDADANAMLEIDVSITKDNVVILSHDTTLNYRTNETGKIRDWTYTDLVSEQVNFGYLNKLDDDKNVVELRKYKNYEDIEVLPTDVTYPDGISPRNSDIFLVSKFEDVLKLFPNNMINVEIKQDGETGLKALEEVVRIVEEDDSFDRVVFASFHNEIYSQIGKYHNEYMKEDGTLLMYSPEYIGAGTLAILSLLGLDALFTSPISVLHLPTSFSILNFDNVAFIKMAHEHNVAVQFWTINDVKTMEHLIEIKSDGIMTDKPHLLAETIKNS